MKRPFPPAALELLRRLMNELGVKPIKYGTLTFNFSPNQVSTREERHVNWEVAPAAQQAQNTSRP